MKKELIEKIKTEHVRLYNLDRRETYKTIFSLYGNFYNEDKSIKIRRQYEYCPELCMTRYCLNWATALGVAFAEGRTGIIFSDPADGDIRIKYDINDYTESEDESLNNFLKEQPKCKGSDDYVNAIIFDKKESCLYVMSKCLDGNTQEKIDAFVDTMNKGGREMLILKKS